MATNESMDEAAKKAEEDFPEVPKEHIKSIADWIEKHYLAAGYKRLAKILLRLGK